jgi:hypothetical protein
VAIDVPDLNRQRSTKYWIIAAVVVLAIIVVLVAVAGGGGGSGGGGGYEAAGASPRPPDPHGVTWPPPTGLLSDAYKSHS